MPRFADRIAFVTGASSGIGRAAALRLAQEGASVVLVAPADDEWLRQLHVNLSGSFYVVREGARRMLPAGNGAIVTSGSELALLGQQGYVGYTATKGGVFAITRAFAAELAPTESA